MKAFLTFILIIGGISLTSGIICTIISLYWPEKWKRKKKEVKFKR